MKKYIYWKEPIYIEATDKERIFLYVDRYQGKIEQYAINDSALEIIETVNGMRTLEQVYDFFCHRYEESMDVVKRNVDTFLYELEKIMKFILRFRKKQSCAGWK